MQWLSSFSRERFGVALLFCGIALAACLIPAQSDTWWQLRTGEEMWRTGRVMLHDEFTHTVHGQPWPNHEWLSQVLFYGLYALGGLPLLTAFCAAVVTLAWGIVFRLTEGPVLFRVATVGAGALLSSPAWCLRPQVLTLGMVALTLWILARWRFVAALPLLFVVWANLHGAVALGGVLVFAAWVAVALTDRTRLARFTVVAILCLFATAASPLGFSLWLEVPHSLSRLQDYGVIEWRAPSMSNVRDLPFWGLAGAIAALAWVRRESLASAVRLRSGPGTLTLLVAAALFFVLGTRSVRNVPPFLLVAIPAITTLARVQAPRARTRAASRPQLVLNAVTLAVVLIGGTAFVAAAWRAPLPRLEWNPISATTISAIAACEGPLYNRYDEGGFLIWFVRDRKVFIDSRQDPFPPDLVKAHIELERTGEYATLFARYNIACALTPGTSPLARHLERDGWQARDAENGWKIYDGRMTIDD